MKVRCGPAVHVLNLISVCPTVVILCPRSVCHDRIKFFERLYQLHTCLSEENFVHELVRNWSGNVQPAAISLSNCIAHMTVSNCTEPNRSEAADGSPDVSTTSGLRNVDKTSYETL